MEELDTKAFLESARSCAEKLARDGRWSELFELSGIANRVERIEKSIASTGNVLLNAGES